MDEQIGVIYIDYEKAFNKVSPIMTNLRITYLFGKFCSCAAVELFV
jgi:hypothetical protein